MLRGWGVDRVCDGPVPSLRSFRLRLHSRLRSEVRPSGDVFVPRAKARGFHPLLLLYRAKARLFLTKMVVQFEIVVVGKNRRAVDSPYCCGNKVDRQAAARSGVQHLCGAARADLRAGGRAIQRKAARNAWVISQGWNRES